MPIGRFLARMGKATGDEGRFGVRKKGAVNKSDEESGRANRSPETTNKNSVFPNPRENVVRSQRDDNEQIRLGLNEPVRTSRNNINPQADETRREAAGRAMTRTGGRAALVSGSGVGAYEAASSLNEAGRKKRDEETKSESKAKEPSKASESKSEDAPAKKDMTFKEAFAAARKAGDDTFSWNGKKYTTEMKGEDKPKPSVREGKNENIDDETRDKAQKFNKGGMVKSKSFTGIRRC